MHYYKRIRELREANHFTQNQIANKLNLHLTTYQRWETGEREIPTHIIVQLSKLYGISSDYILELNNGEINNELKHKLNTLTELTNEMNQIIKNLTKPD